MSSAENHTEHNAFSFEDGQYEVVRVPGDFLKLPFSVLNNALQMNRRSHMVRGKRILPRRQGEVRWTWTIAGSSNYGLPGPKEELLLSIIQRFDSVKFFQSKQDGSWTDLEIYDDQFFEELYGRIPKGTLRKSYRKRLTEAILCLAGTTYFSDRAIFAVSSPGKQIDTEDPDILFSRAFHLFEIERAVVKGNPDANKTIFSFSKAWKYLQRQRYAAPVNYDFIRYLRSKDMVAYRCYQILEFESYKSGRVRMDLRSFGDLVPVSFEDPKQARSILKRGLDVLAQAGYLAYHRTGQKGEGTPFFSPRRSEWWLDVIIHSDKKASFPKTHPIKASTATDSLVFQRLYRAGLGKEAATRAVDRLSKGLLSETYVLNLLRWVDLFNRYGTQPWFQKTWKINTAPGAFLGWALKEDGVATVPTGLFEAGERAQTLIAQEERRLALNAWEAEIQTEEARLTGEYWSFLREKEREIPIDEFQQKFEEIKSGLKAFNPKWTSAMLEDMAKVRTSQFFRESLQLPDQTQWVRQQLTAWQTKNPRPKD